MALEQRYARRRRLDGDDATGPTDPPRLEDGIRAEERPDIEHHLTGLNMGAQKVEEHGLVVVRDEITDARIDP